jgi:hypothetical protein
MSVQNSTLAAALDGVSGIALGAYLLTVVYRGNVPALGNQILADGPGFLEFLVSLYLLTVIVNVKGPVGKIATGVVTLAIIGLTIKTVTRTGAQPFIDFRDGKLGLFGLVTKIATS